jgi:hypothetical protein
MYACLIKWYTGKMIRSSFFRTRETAIKYAEFYMGVQAVEEIGKGIIWERKN